MRHASCVCPAVFPFHRLRTGRARESGSVLSEGQGVAGSNPVIPTNIPKQKADLMIGFLFFHPFGSVRATNRRGVVRSSFPEMRL